MPTYLHPGVYIEEIPSGAKPIEGVSTSTAAFVGPAAKGPVGEATLIQTLDDYKRDFGDVASESDAMGLAVTAFYQNGGKSAYLCRLAGAGSSFASHSVIGQTTGDVNVLTISASSVGTWGNGLYFRILKPDLDALVFDLEIGSQENGKFQKQETFSGLSLREADSNFAPAVVNGTSLHVTLALVHAAEVNGLAEQYQAAVLLGGRLDDNDATLFSAGFNNTPLSMTLNINGLGAKQIVLDPSTFATALGGLNHNTDGNSLATEIVDAVSNLGVEPDYQNVTCVYNNVSHRFELRSAETDSNATIEVYGGPLAVLLRLDNTQRAVLTGADVGNAADLFSAPATGIPSLPSPIQLTLNIDNHGNQTVTVVVGTLAGNNQQDGNAVALAIQNAVRAIDQAVLAYKDFSCSYQQSRFILTAGSASSRQSSLTVTDGPLADLLGLNAADTPVQVVGRQVDQGTALVIPVATLGPLGQGEQLQGGTANPPTMADYTDFYNAVLRKVRDVNIVVLPGQSWAADGSGNPVISATLAHCEDTKSRMLIIDPPPATELDQGATVDALGLPTSTYSVLYYPWLKVANPFYDRDRNPNVPITLTIAPSAFAAGMWAKIDGKRGVWKAPAGVETNLLGVAGLEFNVEDGEQDQLNPLGINAVRKLPSFGSVIWGSRTLATKADPEWRYVPVRRTAIFIEQSIYQGIQWAVFEPNSHPLWGSLRANIGGFMNGLFRAGAFQGATANDAYFVRCGLGDTMTQADIDRGQVIVIVGFAPLKPAEFVIIRIQQKVNQQ